MSKNQSPSKGDNTEEATEQTSESQQEVEVQQERPTRSVQMINEAATTVILERQKRLSGAQKRRLTKEKKMAEGTWVERPRRSPVHMRLAKYQPSASTSAQEGPRNPTISIKRRRMTTNTYSSDEEYPAKRSREEGICGTNLREGSGTIKMAVIRESFPHDKFTEQDLENLQLDLLQKMEGLPPGTGPTFKTCKLDDGAIIIICMDKPSRDWLQRTAEAMNPWNHMILKVRDAKDLIRTSKIIIKLPRAYKDLSPEAVQKKLEIQNTGLQPCNWIVLNRKVEPTGQALVFQVKEEDARVLAARGYKVFFGLSHIQIKSLEKPSTNRGQPAT